MRHFRRHANGFEQPRQVFLVLLPGIFKKISIHTNTAIALRPYDRPRLAWVRGFCGPLDGLNFHF